MNIANFTMPDDDNDSGMTSEEIANLGRSYLESSAEHDSTFSSVYLAGSMEKDLESNVIPYSVLWRKKIKELFEKDLDVWNVIDPTKNVLVDNLYKITEDNSIYYNSFVIVQTDINSVRSCDFFILNLLEDKVTIGSCTELGIAYENKKFIIVILNENSQLKEHPFIKEMADVKVSSIKEAYEICKMQNNDS